jgi:hypothetical protein
LWRPATAPATKSNGCPCTAPSNSPFQTPDSPRKTGRPEPSKRSTGYPQPCFRVFSAESHNACYVNQKAEAGRAPPWKPLPKGPSGHFASHRDPPPDRPDAQSNATPLGTAQTQHMSRNQTEDDFRRRDGFHAALSREHLRRQAEPRRTGYDRLRRSSRMASRASMISSRVTRAFAKLSFMLNSFDGGLKAKM